MSILPKLGNILSKSACTGLLIPAVAAGTTLVADNDLSKLLSSDNLPSGDSFEKTETNNVSHKSNKSCRAIKKEVRKDYGIGFWNDLWFDIKNIFRNQDIQSVLGRKYDVKKNADMETYKEAARKYFREEIGIGQDLSQEQLEKNCNKMNKKFILLITNMPKNKRPELIEIYASVIGELDANMRAKLAEDFIKIAESDEETQSIAKALFNNAEYNLTNPDAALKVPEQESAVEYNNAVFSNMKKEDIDQALKDLGIRAEEVLQRLNVLRTKEQLDEEETKELKLLEIIQANYVEAGYAGAYTGISVNAYLDDNFVTKSMVQIYNDTLKLGIEDKVLEVAQKYVESHLEYQETVLQRRNIDFETLMDKATNGRYSEVKSTLSSSNQKIVETIDSESQKIEDVEAYNEKRTSINNKYTKNENENDNCKLAQIPTETGARQTIKPGSISSPFNEAAVQNKGSSKIDFSIISGSKNGNKTKNYTEAGSNSAELKKLMRGGVKEYIAYQELHKDIKPLDSCVNILNYSQASTALKQYALLKFKSFDKNVKDLVFQRLNTEGQIEASKVMNIEELKNIKNYKSIYSKECIEQRYEMKCEESNLTDIDSKNTLNNVVSAT